MKKLKTNLSAGINQAFGDLSVWVIRVVVGVIVFLAFYYVRGQFVSHEELAQSQKDKDIIEQSHFSDLSTKLAVISSQIEHMSIENAVKGATIDYISKQVQNHDDRLRMIESRQSIYRPDNRSSTTP